MVPAGGGVALKEDVGLVVAEAGGQVVQLDGSPLGPFDGLQDRTTLIAAATPDLLKEMINAILV